MPKNTCAPRLQENDFFDLFAATISVGPTKKAFAALMKEKSTPYSPASDAHHLTSADDQSRHPRGRPPSCGGNAQDRCASVISEPGLPSKVVPSERTLYSQPTQAQPTVTDANFVRDPDMAKIASLCSRSFSLPASPTSSPAVCGTAVIPLFFFAMAGLSRSG